MYDEIRAAAKAAILELLDAAQLKPGQLVVIGCSSSEIMGQKIGKGSMPEAAQAVVDVVLPTPPFPDVTTMTSLISIPSNEFPDVEASHRLSLVF